MSSTVTLKDVGRDAGVSHITVSRVLNRTNGRYPISDRTRKKVLDSINKLNYSPSAVARAMRTRQTGIVALIYCRDDFSHFGNDLFYLGVQGGIEEILGKNGRGLLISSITREELEKGKLPAPVQQGLADAVLTYEMSAPAFIKELINRKLPVVSINRDISNADIDCVIQNDTVEFKKLTEHIIDLGHSCIGLVKSSQYAAACSRRGNGFYMALEEKNIFFNENYNIFANPWTDDAGDHAVEIKKKFPEISAFMCTTDGLAAAVIKGLRKAGWDVPGDISVTGCGGHHPWLTNELALTTIRFDEAEMGEMAVSLILKRMNSKDMPGRTEVQAGNFILGSTVGQCKNNKAASKTY